MFKNRGVWFVRDCGILLEDIKDWDAEVASLTTELTEQEKKSSYAKYYLRQLKMPSHENLKAAEYDNPLPEEKMFMPEEMISRMESGDNIQSGYGVMQNGIGFSITHVLIGGVTDEKIQYFRENFIPEGDLYYKSWYPGAHLRHYMNGCVEDVGMGMELVRFLQFIGPEGWASEYKDPLLNTVTGGAGVSWPLHDLFNKPRYCLYCHYFKDLPDGSGKEVFSAFWHGMSWKDGKPVRMIPEGEKIAIDRVRSQMNHSAWEFTQISELINSFAATSLVPERKGRCQ